MALSDIGKGGFKNVNTQGGALVEMLNQFGQEITNKLRKSIEDKKVFASGNMAQSIRFTTSFFGNKYVFRLMMADYYKDVDKGQPKGKNVSVNNILEWMRDKGIKAGIGKSAKASLKGLKGGERSLMKTTNEQRANVGMAIAIKKNIKKYGTIKRFNYEGSNFYSDVVTDEYINVWKKKIAQAAKKDIVVQIKVRE